MASGASRDSPGSQVPPMPGNTLHCRFEAPPPSSSSTKRCNQAHPATVQLGPRPSLPSFSPRFPPGPGPASAWVGTIRPFLPGSAPPYSTPLLRLVQSESSLQVSPPRPRPRSGQTRHLPRRPRVWRNRPAAYGRRLSQLRPSGAPPHLASSLRGSGRRIPRFRRASGAAAMAVTAEGARRKERVLCLADVDTKVRGAGVRGARGTPRPPPRAAPRVRAPARRAAPSQAGTPVQRAAPRAPRGAAARCQAPCPARRVHSFSGPSPGPAAQALGTDR